MAKKHILITINKYRQSLLFFFVLYLSASFCGVSAQPDGHRAYTAEDPLVYEDAWNLWPYAFKSADGEPDGYNIDLIKLLMKELDIPYVIRLKPWQEVASDMKAHKADLTIGLASGFGELPVLTGRNAIELLTQSVVTPKSQPVAIKNFRDLSQPGTQVIVRDSSFCHHLMVDYGWAANAVVTTDIRESILRVDEKQEGQIVWNSLGLKWLIQHLQLKGVTLTPVNMPYGEYKFMSSDQQLLDRLDEAYSKLYAANQLEQLDGKWFVHESGEPSTSAWVWYLVAAALLLLAFAVVYIVIVRLKDLRTTAANIRLNRRLALIIETCKVRIWTYDVARQSFAWHNDDGQIACTYSSEEFSQRYSPSDFQKLKRALDRLVNREKDVHGHESDDLTLELKAKDVEGGDQNLHDFVVVLSVLSRDKSGRPTVIIGTKKDVTDARYLRQVNAERSLRYWSMFYNSESGVILFDKDGCVSNANLEACEMYHCEIDKKVKERVHFNDWFGTRFAEPDDADGYHATQVTDGRTIEYKINSVHDDHGGLLGLFAFCRYVSATVFLLLFVLQASAQALSERYNRVHPVTIVCEKGNLPYEFVNDKGEPAGFYVDVAKAVLSGLDLNAEFMMVDKPMVRPTFEDRDVDLILTDGRNYQRPSFYVSANAVDYVRVSADSVIAVHFVGKDRQLIEQMSAQLARLQQQGDIAAIKSRWSHPEKAGAEPVMPVFYIVGCVLLLAVLLYLMTLMLQAHVRRVSANSSELQEIMQKALHMGDYDVMTYDIARNRFTNQYGTILPEEGLTLEAYIQCIDSSQRAEFSQKMKNMIEGRKRHFELNKRWNHGTCEAPEYHYFQGHAICETDKKGRPVYIINAVSDVTQETKEFLASRNLKHYYDVLLGNPFVAMKFYDKKGAVIDNNKAMRKLGDVKDAKHIQPLYDARGEIACFFVSKAVGQN